jgi:hypothetical protein
MTCSAKTTLLAAGLLAFVASIGCGGSQPAGSAASAPAPGAASPAAPAPTAAAPLTALEPGDGTFAGHIGTFRWSPVEGADGYRLKLTAATDGRAVWESPVVPKPELELPATVGLEPEAYVWQVTALRGSESLQTSRTFKFTVTP